MVKKNLLILSAFMFMMVSLLSGGASVVAQNVLGFQPWLGGGMGFFPVSSVNAGDPAYLLRGPHGFLWVTENAVWLTRIESQNLSPFEEQSADGLRKGVHIKITFPESNPQAKLIPEQPLPGHVSLLRGNDAADWQGEVGVWGAVRIQDLYQGVDLVLRSTPEGFGWGYEVSDEGSLDKRSPKLQGAQGRIQAGSGTVLSTAIGDLTLPALGIRRKSHQGEESPDIAQDSSVGGFNIAPAAMTEPSPNRAFTGEMLYSTFVGGSGNDTANDVAVDQEGDIYIVGTTPSADFPVTPGAFDETGNNSDAFVAKINMSTAPPTLAFATYLGGVGAEKATSLAVDGGVAYLTGETDSPDFPGAATGAALVDAFVVALNQTGSGLLYSRLLGGADIDKGYAIAVEEGAAYLTGITYSDDFPTTDGTSYNRYGDIFVEKLSSDGSTAYATLLGTREVDAGHGIDVRQGVAWVTGETWAKGLTDDNIQEGAVFVLNLNPEGGIGSVRVFDGLDDDRGFDLVLDSNANIYVTGFTFSSDFPVTEGTLGGMADAFLLKLTPSSTVYAAFLGGSAIEIGEGIDVDVAGGVIITGSTNSTDFPVTGDAFQGSLGGDYDAFITRFYLDGDDIGYRAYSTFLGGTGNDFSESLAMHGLTSGYFVGNSRSSNFPVTDDALYASLNGVQDAFLSVMTVGDFPAVNIEKYTNGQDSDYAPGEYLLPEETVQWTYVISNPGEVPLTNIAVNDDQGLSVSCPQSSLASGEQMTCTTPDGEALVGQYENIGSVTAYSDVFDLWINDADPSHYFGAQPSIDLVKYINGLDANTAPGFLVFVGDPLVWTYSVINDGNVDLKNVTVVDDMGTPDDLTDDLTVCEIGLLPAGQTDSATCQLPGTASAGTYVNHAMVTGTPPGGLEEVSDQDLSHYYGVEASIQLTKLTNGVDANEPQDVLVKAGGEVTCTYEIINNSNVELTAVTVVDDMGTPDDSGDDQLICEVEVLPPGETNMVSCQHSGTAAAGAYSNTAEATGTVPGGLGEVSDLDTSHYYGVAGLLQVTKYTNGQLGGEGLGVLIPVMAPVTWTYEVTNNGNVVLTDVNVVDDSGTAGDSDDDVTVCTITSLGVGETHTPNCELTGTASAGAYANTATATGTLPEGLGEVSGQDLSQYYGAAASIKISKLINGHISNEMPGILLPEDGEVSWTYEVTNDGNVDLLDVTVVDDNGTSGVTDDDVTVCVIPVLGPGLTDSTSCEMYGEVILGQYGNTAEVQAIIPQGLGDVRDEDTSYYFGIDASIQLRKFTNGHEAVSAPGVEVLMGEPVTWTYEVINDGNVDLTGVKVVDDWGTPEDSSDDVIVCEIDLLAANSTYTGSCQLTGTAAAGGYANHAEVTGTLPGGVSVVKSQAVSHYFGINASLSLVKLTNGKNVDSALGVEVHEGEIVVWNYHIINEGNVALSELVLIDDNGTQDDPEDDIKVCVIDQLPPGAGDTSSCSLQGIASLGQYTNSAWVIGVIPNGFGEVRAEDKSFYFGVEALPFHIFLPLILR